MTRTLLIAATLTLGTTMTAMASPAAINLPHLTWPEPVAQPTQVCADANADAASACLPADQ